MGCGMIGIDYSTERGAYPDARPLETTMKLVNRKGNKQAIFIFLSFFYHTPQKEEEGNGRDRERGKNLWMNREDCRSKLFGPRVKSISLCACIGGGVGRRKGLVQSLLLTIDHDFILRRRPNTIGYHREKGGNGEEERNQRARQVLFWKKKKKLWGPSSKRDVLVGLQQ